MSTPSREDVGALTEALAFGVLAGDVEAGRAFRESIARRLLASDWLAAREAAARDAGARAVAATRWRCPVHGIPDCSPLLNGCSIPNHIANAVARAINHTED